MLQRQLVMSALILSLSHGHAPLIHAESGLGIWSQGAPAPSKRTEIAATTLGSKIYAVGGFNRPSISNILDFAVSRDVEIYNPATDSWTVSTPLPEGRHHAGIAAHGGFLYVIGGFTKSGLTVWHPVNTVYEYDPVTQTWRERAPMPTARGALGVTVHQGRIYAIGGYDGKQNTGATEIYDPATDSWTTGAPLSAPRDHLAVAAAGSKIYAIGGRSNLKYQQNTSVVEAYDSASDQWEYKANLPTARSGIGAGVINDHIYILGGESDEGTFDSNEKYLPDNDRWVIMPPMPTARHGLGVAVVDGRLYAIGGGTSPGASFSQITEIFDQAPALQ
ncbi:N-acetylneuraminic acid mutarotase [Nitrosomonas marina]|uniref:N-acetylneuraminic acid mutarotase n=1 Tax=Nitrosomonas marina TaxID=917 RepID=A0A1H9Y6A9_9PROT|nr:kelch repeat-containing protein [Nitrosomonas marina]SES64347.1 N-acetylneuraminic acid mutarotase [Nitrosomonas marina]